MKILLALLLTAVAASFFGMLIYRLNNGVSLFKPSRSFCPHCRQQLKLFDLIPFFGYLFLKGQCRYCGKKIASCYFLLETIFIGLTLLMMFYNLPFSLIGLSLIMVVILFSDLLYREIPYTFMLLLLSFVFYDLYPNYFLPLQNLLLILIFYLFIVLVEKFYYKREIFGRADIILFTILSFYFSSRNFILFLYLSFIVGALFSICLILLKKVNRETVFPFAPFIVISFFLTKFWADKIISVYFSLMGI